MRPRGTLYQCIQAEARSLVPLPQSIQSEQLFTQWCQTEVKRSVCDPDSLLKLEQLFLPFEVKFILNVDGVRIESPLPKGKYCLEFVIECTRGMYSSPRCPLGTDMIGLEGLEFWLRSLKLQLPKVSKRPTISVFVVGTHLDAAEGSVIFRRERVMNVVQRANIGYDVSIHEVSIYPSTRLQAVGDFLSLQKDSLAGIREFETDLLSSILKLPHMGEVVPNSYLSILQTIKQLSSSYRVSGRGSSLLLTGFFLTYN